MFTILFPTIIPIRIIDEGNITFGYENLEGGNFYSLLIIVVFIFLKPDA